MKTTAPSSLGMLISKKFYIFAALAQNGESCVEGSIEHSHFIESSVALTADDQLIAITSISVRNG